MTNVHCSMQYVTIGFLTKSDICRYDSVSRKNIQKTFSNVMQLDLTKMYILIKNGHCSNLTNKLCFFFETSSLPIKVLNRSREIRQVISFP